MTSSPPATPSSARSDAPRDNPFLSLVLNVALPAVILTFLSRPERLGPLWALIIALSFPIAYGSFDAVRRRKLNLFSAIGFVSILLTGGLGLFPSDPIWFALKEAVIPLVFAAAIVASHATPRPLIRQLVWNPDIIDTRKVEELLEKQNRRADLDRLLLQCSFILAAGLAVSGAANFLISMRLLRGTTGGTTAYMEAVGTQTWVTWLVIGLPLMGVMIAAMARLFRGVRQLTGLTADDLVHGGSRPAEAKSSGAE